MTNEEIVFEINRIKANLPDDSDLEGVMLLLIMNLSLMVEVRCLLKGMAEAQRLGNWAGMAFGGIKEPGTPE